jgi:hypothetical protein
MADTDVDAVRKRKNAERIKYRLKRKLLLQRQASTSSETELVRKQKKAEYDKQYRLKRKLLMKQPASISSEIELVRKQKKAEYDKQYSMKRKFLLQQQASTSSETRTVVMRIGYIFERIACISLA